MDEKDEYQEFKTAVFFHRIVGVWQEDDQVFGRFSRAKIRIFAAVSLSICFFQFSFLLVVKDLENLPDYVIEATSTSIGMIKIVPFIMIRDRILELIQLTKETREPSNINDEELEILKRWQNYQNITIKMVIQSYTPIVLLYMVAPMISDKPFPLQGIHPQIAFEKPWYYVTYGIEVTFMAMNLCSCISSDAFMITFMCQLCAKLELVRLAVKKLATGDKRSIPRVIRRHAIALDYGVKVCDTVSLVFILQYATISIFISFSGITLLNTKSTVVFIKTLSIAIIALGELLIFCFVGELVSDASFDVATTLQKYSLDSFYDDPESLRALKLILCRAQKPLRIVIGWTISMNLQFFADTINKLIRAFIVLKSVMDSNR